MSERGGSCKFTQPTRRRLGHSRQVPPAVHHRLALFLHVAGYVALSLARLGSTDSDTESTTAVLAARTREYQN